MSQLEKQKENNKKNEFTEKDGFQNKLNKKAMDIEESNGNKHMNDDAGDISQFFDVSTEFIQSIIDAESYKNLLIPVLEVEERDENILVPFFELLDPNKVHEIFTIGKDKSADIPPKPGDLEVSPGEKMPESIPN